MSTTLCLLIALTLFAPLPAQAWNGTVDQIIDGDSLIIQRTDTNEKVHVRLYGIDAPEIKQRYGGKATDFLGQCLPKDTQIQAETIDIDMYHRDVAILYKQGQVINAEMIRNGVAWFYPAYCKAPICTQWKKFEQTARQNKVGLWADKKPLAPWKWRRKHPRR